MLVYVLAIGAAAMFGVGSVVQQRAAAKAPPERALRLSLLWWLLQQPLWLLGIGTGFVGNVMSATALGRGSVALVQPMLASRLLFALPLAAAWMRRSVPRRDWAGAVAIAAGLGTFVVAGQPHQASEINPSNTSWVIAGGSIVAIAVGLAALARGTRPARAAPLLAAGAGAVFGLQAALTHTAVHRLSTDGFVATFLSWTPYAVGVTAVFGMLLIQSAYEMAPLPASFPVVVATEPMSGIGVGVGVLGGSIRLAPLPFAAEVGGLGVMTLGIYLLATSPLVTGQLDLLERRHEEGLAFRTEEELERDLAAMRRDLDRLEEHVDEPALARKDRRHLHRDLERVCSELDRLDELQSDIDRHRNAEHERAVAYPHEVSPDMLAHDRELDERQQDLAERAERLRRRADRLRDRAEAWGPGGRAGG